jgi:hypothetical protein
MHAGVDLGVERLAEERRCHHVVRGTYRNNATVPQKEDTRRKMRGRVELVHRDDAREAIAGSNLGEQIVQIETVAYVEKRRRLVQQEQARPLRKCARDGDSALLAAAQLFDAPSGQAGEITPSERFLDGGPILGPLLHPTALVWRAAHGDHVAHPEAKGDHLALWHEGDQAREEPAVEAAHVSAHHADGSLARVEEPRGDPKQRRLAGPVWAE